MPKRKNIEIKTRYEAIEDLINNCRDIKRETTWGGGGLIARAKISGEVYSDGSFELSSTKQHGNMFEFIGKAEERLDGIYMVGEIKLRGLHSGLAYMTSIMGIIFGVFMMLICINQGSVVQGLVLGLWFFLVPVLNILIIKCSDKLYRDIIRKVC